MSEETEEVLALRAEITYYRKILKALIDQMLVPNTTAIGLRNALEKYPDFDHARPDRPKLPPYKPNSLLDETTT